MHTLYVYMNGLLVGKLEKMSTGNLRFTYDENWMNRRAARPISLSLPLVHKPFVGDIVYNFFDMEKRAFQFSGVQ